MCSIIGKKLWFKVISKTPKKLGPCYVLEDDSHKIPLQGFIDSLIISCRFIPFSLIHGISIPKTILHVQCY